MERRLRDGEAAGEGLTMGFLRVRESFLFEPWRRLID